MVLGLGKQIEHLHKLGDKDKHILELMRRLRYETWRVEYTLRVAFSRKSPSLTFLHFNQRVFGLRLPSLSR